LVPKCFRITFASNCRAILFPIPPRAIRKFSGWSHFNFASVESEVSMPAKQHSAIPAYQRIQSSIRKRIDAGQLRPGDPVTSERDLAKLHEVSLMTARHALASLEREGIVERRRGIGTFVAEPKIHFNKLMSYTEQMAARSLVAASKILFGKMIDDEPEVAARLALAPADSIVKLQRLRHADQEPFALETCYVSAVQFPALLSAPLQRDSLFAILERDYGVKLGYADEEIDATAADPQTSELLNVPRREPLLRIRQLIYSTNGKPLMYVLGIYRSDRHNFVIRRYR
jgi:GntR family transcriptional regulator